MWVRCLSRNLCARSNDSRPRSCPSSRRNWANRSPRQRPPPGQCTVTETLDPSKRKDVTLVTGVIGSDTHIVGNRILSMALEEAGYTIVTLGALTPADEFIKAAIETAADGIMVSSLYGQGELDCRGFRELCVEAGLGDTLLYVGGNLVVGKTPWDVVEKRFLDMGFDRAFPPGTRTPEVIDALDKDFAARTEGKRISDS
ncbi:MAG: methylaspartate mutase subunit S [Thiotrichales bacterium]|nr:methylaspartate mutase subunit S [Thiotrichales bacterium]